MLLSFRMQDMWALGRFRNTNPEDCGSLQQTGAVTFTGFKGFPNTELN